MKPSSLASTRTQAQKYNSLSVSFPSLAAQFHPEKNSPLTAADITLGSGKKIWWVCTKGHEWKAAVYSRTKGAGCPFCAKSSQTSFPEHAVFYYLKSFFPAKNRFRIGNAEIDIWLPCYQIAAEYDGGYYHNKTVSERDRKKNEMLRRMGYEIIRIRENPFPARSESEESVYCIDCSYESTYAYLNPVICRLFFLLSFLTGMPVPAITADVQRDRIEIMQQYLHREKENSLQYKIPESLLFWNYSRNGTLTPDLFTEKSNQKVWWKCKYGHEWQATIHRFSGGTRCPYCDGKKVWRSFNDLLSVNPALAEQWDYEKNDGILPKDILANAQKKYWWKCPYGHSWKASPYSRGKRVRCPVCTRKKSLWKTVLQLQIPALPWRCILKKTEV